jgi:hypothetical protein
MWMHTYFDFWILLAAPEALLFHSRSGAFFRLAPGPGKRPTNDAKVPVEWAVALAAPWIREHPRDIRWSVTSATHEVRFCGRILAADGPPRLMASAVDTCDGPYLFCGRKGAGKTTLMNAFVQGGKLSGHERPYLLTDENPRPCAVWMLEQERRRPHTGLVLARLSPLTTALRVLQHIEGPPSFETYEMALSFARSFVDTPSFDVTLPASILELRLAVAHFVSTQNLTAAHGSM